MRVCLSVCLAVFVYVCGWVRGDKEVWGCEPSDILGGCGSLSTDQGPFLQIKISFYYMSLIKYQLNISFTKIYHHFFISDVSSGESLVSNRLSPETQILPTSRLPINASPARNHDRSIFDSKPFSASPVPFHAIPSLTEPIITPL